jgi:hypothetical protein
VALWAHERQRFFVPLQNARAPGFVGRDRVGRQCKPHDDPQLAHGWARLTFRASKSIFFTSPSFAFQIDRKVFPPLPGTSPVSPHSPAKNSGSGSNMSAMRKHNVTTFPRPPIVERTNRHIQIKWHGQLVADCPPGEAYWVLEAHHAPGPFPLLGFSISITMIFISFSIGWPLAIAAKNCSLCVDGY